ncbi:MAG: DUF4019 domain-containing protein [Lysobacterales bacterium]|jgi:predicted PurR-regulated permease PerM
MTKLIGTFLVMVLFSAISMAGTAEGVPSAIKWLEVVDSGEYVESWNKAAPYFQTQISSDQWEQALKKVRKPLGRVITREVTTSSSHTSLPGVPDGDYVVVVLSTSYEHKRSATETVTVSKVGDDWRAVGYFIK